MNEKPPSTGGSSSPGLIARVLRAIKDEPWSRDEIQNFIETDAELDAEEKSMLSGVLEVSETQVREVMVPRSQMVKAKPRLWSPPRPSKTASRKGERKPPMTAGKPR